MIKGFVFGKFLPFHKGHESMINFALTKCDFLTILICCSNKEKISCETRKSWLARTYKSVKNVEIRIFDYNESELPNTSASSLEVSKAWSEKFKNLFPDYHIVVTSEEYGNYVAAYMGIQHISFDIEKKLFPVSATTVKNDLFSNWQFLPESVKSYLAIKVVLLGTESTGKTTLTERLAQHYCCTFVSEAGRELITDSKAFEFHDLQIVAAEHAKRIEKALIDKSPLIIIDTDIYITKSYASFIFSKELEVDNEIYITNKADLYLYLNNDVEYVQDGTRLSFADREKLDISHREMLKTHNIDFVEISGNWEQRFEKSTSMIDELIMIKHKKLFGLT